MSAIGGILRLDGGQIDQAIVARMKTVLTPYGRDSQQTKISGTTAFIRTLLKVTLEDQFDQQPLFSRDKHLILLFDGRIDNRDELINKLSLNPLEFKNTADSAIVLHAFERYGEKALKHLLGDFALALWEQATHTLLLARDPVGQRPLYWHRQSGFFIFATMCKGLFEYPDVPKKLCKSRMAEHLALLPINGPESFYQGIYRVEPGQILKLKDGKIHSRYYHRFDPENRITFPNDDDYVEAFKEHLEKAVQSRLRSASGIGSHMSSGFDSSTTTITAAHLLKRQGRKLSAYTAIPRKSYSGFIPNGRIADEGPFASAIAAQCDNIEHLLIQTSSQNHLSNIEQRLDYLDMVPRNPLNNIWIDTISLSAAKREERVILNAQKGNSTISYHGNNLHALLLHQGKWKNWYKETSQLQGHNRFKLFMASIAPQIPQAIWLPIAKHILKRVPSLKSYSMINDFFVTQSGILEKIKNNEFNSRQSPDSRQLRIDMIYRHDMGNHYAAANCLANIEMRDPTIDKPLIEFCLAIPEEQYFHHGKNRRLIRRLWDNKLSKNTKTISHKKGVQYALWHDGIERSLPKIHHYIDKFSYSENVTECLDLRRMRSVLNNNEWLTPNMIHRYISLLRGIYAGEFICSLKKN